MTQPKDMYRLNSRFLFLIIAYLQHRKCTKWQKLFQEHYAYKNCAASRKLHFKRMWIGEKRDEFSASVWKLAYTASERWTSTGRLAHTHCLVTAKAGSPKVDCLVNAITSSSHLSHSRRWFNLLIYVCVKFALNRVMFKIFRALSKDAYRDIC